MFKKTMVRLMFFVSFFIGSYNALNEIAFAQEASLVPVSDALTVPPPQIDVTDSPTITPDIEIPAPVDPKTTLPATPTDSDQSLTNDTAKKVVNEPLTQSLATQQQDPASVPRSTTKQLLPNIDQASGALLYTLPIVIPPGRNGLQPDLKLTYNNQVSEDGAVFSSGWSINIPYIERINKKGSEQLYSQNYFNSSLSGEIIQATGTSWAPKVENGDFLTYTFSSSTWLVKDKKGTIYKFGFSSSTRQDNPSDSTQIYRWMLEEVRDTNNNYIKYEYYKDSGQIYPSRIVYTGNNTTDGIFEINFVRQSRSDVMMLSKPGFNVTSKYLISEINTKVSSTLARKYTLTYSTGGNGYRSLLSSVVESGVDDFSVTTTLPATAFSYQTQTPGWSNSSSTIPVRFKHDSQSGNGTQVGDVNGDGLVDVLFSGYEWDATSSAMVWRNRVYLNNGNGWTLDTSWSIPEKFITLNWIDSGAKVMDVNGDGLADILFSGYEWDATSSAYTWRNRVDINNGSGWAVDTSWSIPVPFILNPNTGLSDNGSRLFDINGDGLPDILVAPGTNYGSTAVYLNTGNGWSSNTSFTIPARFMLDQTQQQASDLADVNGDGLMDFLFSGPEWDTPSNAYVQKSHVWLNNGSNWILDASTTIPEKILSNGFLDVGTRFADVNGDGLSDVLFSGYEWDATSSAYTWRSRININNGHGWTLDSSRSIPLPFVQNPATGIPDNGTRLFDVNGDGIPDVVQADWTGSILTYTDNDKKVDSVIQIAGNKGSASVITYKPSTSYVSGSSLLNPKSPLILETVSQIAVGNGFGSTSTTQYTYAQGGFYFNGPFDRKFSGFGKITGTDSVGNVTISYYHQGNTSDTTNGEYDDQWSKIGKLYRTENRDSSNNLYRLIVNKWDRSNLATGRDFVKLVRATTLTYDGNASHRDTTEEYGYDTTYGNLTSKTMWGEVTGSNDGSFTDTGNDKAVETIAYVANTGNYIVGLPYDDTVVDQSGTKVNETRTYYDTLALGSVGAGNSTKVEQWKTSSTYTTTQKSYNTTFGLVASSTDERGKVTTYSYDSYNLYPATTTNPMSRTTLYVYDYSLGKPKQTTDQNSLVYQTVFDGFDRVIQEKVPDFTTPFSPVTKTTYVYTDTVGSVGVQKTDYLDAANTVDTYQYFDGLGRIIQDRKEAETGGTFNVKDFTYNNIGLLQSESLRYTGSGSSRTTPTGVSSLYTTYTYDPLQRVSSVTNNTGATSYAYDDWKTSVTDVNSKQKNYYKDAYGNLSKVDEVLSGATYSTNYGWDLNGKLTNITDALGNVRAFTYDGLGRRLTAEDLHNATDTTFGTWSYTYDDAGNITQSINPLSQTVNYVYDDVNRVTSEDYTSATGTEITYTYDSCTKGVGKLCSVSVLSGATSTYAYDSLGNVATDTEIINATSYTTSYSYDRQGNILTITTPDNAQVKYTFNTAGLLEKIERKESGGSFVDVVSNFDYSPLDQVATQAYVNGVTTTNTYDSTKLYRLTRKLTQNATSTKLQDLNYTYDNIGNITQLIDSSNGSSTKTANYIYDDLYRLVTATITAVASGTSAYTHTFTYDIVGNLLTSPIGTYLYQGNTGVLKANPHAATSINGVTYTYDANGNLTSNGTLTNTWNYRNQLTQSVIASTTLNDYYDYQGNRVWYKVATSSTYYPNKYYNTDTTKKTKQIFAGDQLVATIETVGTTTVPYYNHVDHLGSITSVSNASGTPVETLDYYPFGGRRISSGSYTGQRQYIGQVYDVTSGLDYLNARYYKADIGKFISQDPSFLSLGDERLTKQNTGKELQDYLMDPQAFNSYSYAANNPLVKSDPTGKYLEVSSGGTLLGLSGSAGLRVGFNGVNVFAAGGTGIGFGGGPISISINGADVSRGIQSSVNIGGSISSPFGGLVLERSGTYQPSTYTLLNQSNQASITFGRLGVETYVRKEVSVSLIGGSVPNNLLLTNTSNFSTPNYQSNIPNTKELLNNSTAQASTMSAANKAAPTTSLGGGQKKK